MQAFINKNGINSVAITDSVNYFSSFLGSSTNVEETAVINSIISDLNASSTTSSLNYEKSTLTAMQSSFSNFVNIQNSIPNTVKVAEGYFDIISDYNCTSIRETFLNFYVTGCTKFNYHLYYFTCMIMFMALALVFFSIAVCCGLWNSPGEDTNVQADTGHRGNDLYIKGVEQEPLY